MKGDRGIFPSTMEAGRNLSIQDLLCLLNEKLCLEHTKLRDTSLHPAAFTASLESEVSERQPTHPPGERGDWSDCSELYRSRVLKPVHTVSSG